MALIEIDGASVVAARASIERALVSGGSEGEKAVQKLVAQALEKARKSAMVSAEGSMKNDPRQARLAVRRSVYKRILGGQVNILASKRAGKKVEMKREPKAGGSVAEGRRGGNRRPRSARTEQVDSYWGKDRGFVLRFVNSGTGQRMTRYGNRGSIVGRNWFASAGKVAMDDAAAWLCGVIDAELAKLINETK